MPGKRYAGGHRGDREYVAVRTPPQQQAWQRCGRCKRVLSGASAVSDRSKPPTAQVSDTSHIGWAIANRPVAIPLCAECAAAGATDEPQWHALRPLQVLECATVGAGCVTCGRLPAFALVALERGVIVLRRLACAACVPHKTLQEAP